MLCFRHRSGFTLIELLIVVAIIAILAAIAVPNFLEAQTRAKVSRVKTDLRSLATALESYYVDHNNYVPSAASMGGAQYWGNAPEDQAFATAWLEFIDPGGNTKEGGGFFYMLSTPVAYIANSYVKDPFFNDTGSQYGIFNNYVRYTAFNSDVLVGWHSNSQPAQGIYVGKPIGEFQAAGGDEYVDAVANPQISWWYLWSAGPDMQTGVFAEWQDLSNDTEKLEYFNIGKLSLCPGWLSKKNDRNNIEAWSKAAVMEVSLAFMYDPTNGTRSQGNLIRLGGGRPKDPNILYEKSWNRNSTGTYGFYQYEAYGLD